MLLLVVIVRCNSSFTCTWRVILNTKGQNLNNNVAMLLSAVSLLIAADDIHQYRELEAHIWTVESSQPYLSTTHQSRHKNENTIKIS